MSSPVSELFLTLGLEIALVRIMKLRTAPSAILVSVTESERSWALPTLARGSVTAA